MTPAVTFAELLTAPVLGADNIRRCRARVGEQATPCEVIALPSCDGETLPYAAGHRVLVVVSGGGDINAGVYVVAHFIPEQDAPANSAGAHVIRAPRGKNLFIANDEDGGGLVVVGDARPSGWGNDGIALVGTVAQHVAYLQAQIDALVAVVDHRLANPFPAGDGAATAALAPVQLFPPPALDWIRGAVGVTGGNA